MKRLFVNLVIVVLLAGCAGNSIFCKLNFADLKSQITSDINYINSRYDFYVGLLKSGNEKARPWVVAADLALAQLVPILQGLQQGVCYPQAQVNQGIDMVSAAKSVEP